MATTTLHPIMHLILLFYILTAIAVAVKGLRDIPTIQSHDDVIQPELFINHDRGYLIPGVGRGIKPKLKDGFNPFTYNPVTGDNDGIAGHVPRYGRVGGGSDSNYIPGGDDTFVPNPGFEVPNPRARTGAAPGPIGD